MTILLGILGLAGLYAIGHFFVIQHNKEYVERTTYEKAITWVAIVYVVLVFIGIMAG